MSNVICSQILICSREYHSNAALFGGRKGGSQVNVAPPREFSKKQKQRYRRRVEAMKEKEKTAEGGMKKVSDTFLKEKMATPQAQEFVEKMSDEYALIICKQGARNIC